MLKYPKVTAEEADKAANNKSYELLEEGCYRFTIKKVEEKISTSGNSYYNYQLAVCFNDKRYVVFDKLILTSGWAWKIRHFCESINRLKDYDSDTFDGGNANDTGIFIVKTKGYGDEKQNEVVDYLTEAKAKEKGIIVKNEGHAFDDKKDKIDEELNDEIPF
jgi:hypothetical protein